MSNWDTASLAAADKQFVWHPFTSLADWCQPGHEPIILVGGEGATLRDSRGREYIDGNSSIWTNIHGHNHPHLNAAISAQLRRVAHTSFLGFTHPPAIELARRLIGLFPSGTMSRVFFSDDGSTAIEAALRIVEQFWALRGSHRRQFIAFRDAYHGDTAGAASLGAAAMFGLGQGGWCFPGRTVSGMEELEALSAGEAAETAAVVIEPIVQGAAGMKMWPAGTLVALRRWCDANDVLLIADEVLTGFGRTGKMFACEHDGVLPDMMTLGKALSGGYLPIAATVVSEKVSAEFERDNSSQRTLFYGHSYTANALAAAAANASLDLFDDGSLLAANAGKALELQRGLELISRRPAVADVRVCGLIGAIDLEDQTPGRGAEVCVAARKHGLLTRPIRNTIVLMPPYCISTEEVQRAILAIERGLTDVFGNAERGAK